MPRSRLCTSLALLALAGACTCAAGVSRADDASPSDVATARKLAREGVKLADAGKCAEAIEPLSRAENLYHAPTILGRLGECQVAVGRLVEGTENLQRVVRESLPSNAPAPFVAAKTRARKVLDKALPRLAHLTVEVTAPAGVEYTVKLDGTRLPKAAIGVERPTDPGDHTVEVAAEEHRASTKNLTLGEGRSARVELSLEPDPEAIRRRKAKAASPTPVNDGTIGRKKTLAYVSFGVGGAGLLVGSVFGVMAISARSDLDAECPNKVCPTGAEGRIDAAKVKGTVSTIGFVVGGVGVAGGALLLLWPESAEVKAGGAAWRPWVGVGTAGLEARY